MSENKSLTRKGVTIRELYSIIMALLPVIMIWNVPVLEFGLSTLLLGVFAPYALLRYRFKEKRIKLLPMAIFLFYCLMRSRGSTMNQFLLIIVLIHVYGAVQGSLDVRIMRKTIETVAVVGTVAVLVQTAYYYVFGSRLWLLIPELILKENRFYFDKGVGSLYRPAAFFLEPSHYTQYCCLGLLSVLFPLNEKKADIRKAAWIMLGCFLTTSGMGIVLCIGVFGWYVLFTRQKSGKKLISVFGWAIVAVVSFVILMQFDFFAKAVQRVFGEVDGYNAIWGRTLHWNNYIAPLTGKIALYGFGPGNEPNVYFTGFMSIIYSYGYMGAILLVCACIYFFVFSRDKVARCICLIYIGLMCIEDLSGFIRMCFWVCLFIGHAEYTQRIYYRKTKNFPEV